MSNDLDLIFLRLGAGGAEDKAEQTALLHEAAEILRSGEPVSANAREKLANLIDPNKRFFPYKLILAEDKDTKRIYEKNAASMTAALEVEARMKEKSQNKSSAVIGVSEGKRVSERMVYDRLRQHNQNFPDGCSDDVKMIFSYVQQMHSTPTEKK